MSLRDRKLKDIEQVRCLEQAKQGLVMEKSVTVFLLISFIVGASITLYQKQYLQTVYFLLCIVPIILSYWTFNQYQNRIKIFLKDNDIQHTEHLRLVKEHIGLFSLIKETAEYLKSRLEYDDIEKENMEKVIKWANDNILKLEIHSMTTRQVQEKS